MRTLRFIVENGSIKQDPTCNFSGLFPGRNPEMVPFFGAVYGHGGQRQGISLFRPGQLCGGCAAAFSGEREYHPENRL